MGENLSGTAQRKRVAKQDAEVALVVDEKSRQCRLISL
jgi:hypothetical protein